MAIEDRTRHERLRSLLPRIYATDPDTSALGRVLEMLADLLREADSALERALRDKWLATASGDRGASGENGEGGEPAGEDDEGGPLPVVELGGAPLPLELLGAAVDLVRQPWEVSHEAYRTRVRLLAPMLASGLATPRVLLAFALTSMHAEPCPVLERREDATQAVGLPPGTLNRCRVCRGGDVPPPGAPCPFRGRAIMDATLTDNPRTRVALRRRTLDPAPGTAEGGPHSARLRVRSDSLFAAKPEIVLQVPEAAATPVVASFRSLSTGEEVVVAWPLPAGATLTLRPASPHDPATPRHLQRWVDRPPGEARAPARIWVVSSEGVDLLDSDVFVTQGPRFDSARFSAEDETVAEAPAHFASLMQRIDSPSLPPGESTWLYRPLDRDALADALADVTGKFDVGEIDYGDENQGDDPEERERKREQKRDQVRARLQQAVLDTPDTPSDTMVDLTLSWWTRPPSRFRLRIPRTAAVKAALASGAADHLRQMIDRVRPAGVQPIFDFAELPFPEPLEPRDALRRLDVLAREPVAPGDRDGFTDLDVVLAEPLEPADQAGFLGIFDVTRFDISRFTVTTAEPGIFEVTYFDYSLAQALPIEPGSYDQTYYDAAELHALSSEPARLDGTYFDNARLGS
ncbi:MAG TPA: hypothetical protein VNM90_09460 [Haliangium sp.]|nr:hypothetical protein [Haliangium sp.]